MKKVIMKVESKNPKKLAKKILKFTHPEIKNVSMCLIGKKEIEITYITNDIDPEARMLLVKEFNQFLERCGSDQYEYDELKVTPAQFTTVEKNKVSDSETFLEPEMVIADVVNSRRIGVTYTNGKLVELLELTFLINCEKIVFQVIPVSLEEDDLSSQLMKIGAINIGNGVKEVIRKNFVGHMVTIGDDVKKEHVIIRADKIPEEYAHPEYLRV